jgi:dTMP kinase
VILVDVPIEVGLERRKQGEKAQMTRFEDLSRHDAEFHQRVRDGYLEMAAADPERWRIIDGNRPIEVIAPDVLAAALEFLATSEPNADLLRMNEQTALR